MRPGIHLFVGPNTNVYRWLVPHARHVRNVAVASDRARRCAANAVCLMQNHEWMFRTIHAETGANRPTMAFSLAPPSPRAGTNEITHAVARFLDGIAERTVRETRILIAVPSSTDLFHVEFHVRTAGLSSTLAPDADHDHKPLSPKAAAIPHTIWHCDDAGAVYDYAHHEFDLVRAARLVEFARRQTNGELMAAVMNHKDWGVRHACAFASPETMALDFLRRVRDRRRRWRRWVREWIVVARFLRRAVPRARLLYRRSLAPGGRLARGAKRRFVTAAMQTKRHVVGPARPRRDHGLADARHAGPRQLLGADASTPIDLR